MLSVYCTPKNCTQFVQKAVNKYFVLSMSESVFLERVHYNLMCVGVCASLRNNILLLKIRKQETSTTQKRGPAEIVVNKITKKSFSAVGIACSAHRIF